MQPAELLATRSVGVFITLLLFILPASAQLFVTNYNWIIVSTPGKVSVKTNAPAGQSFTALTNSLGWVEFLLDDANPSNGLPCVLHVDLRAYEEDTLGKSGAVTGAVIASSSPVTLTNGHSGKMRFIFPTNVSLAIGTKYWWHLVSDSGDDVWAHYYHLSIPQADVIYNGTNGGAPNSIWDMAFNAGLISKYPEFKNVALAEEVFFNLDGTAPVDFSCDLEGMIGQQFVVEQSTNLLVWSPLLTNSFNTSPKRFGYPLAARPDAPPPRLFFRMRYLDPQ